MGGLALGAGLTEQGHASCSTFEVLAVCSIDTLREAGPALLRGEHKPEQLYTNLAWLRLARVSILYGPAVAFAWHVSRICTALQWFLLGACFKFVLAYSCRSRRFSEGLELCLLWVATL